MQEPFWQWIQRLHLVDNEKSAKEIKTSNLLKLTHARFQRKEAFSKIDVVTSFIVNNYLEWMLLECFYFRFSNLKCFGTQIYCNNDKKTNYVTIIFHALNMYIMVKV